MVKPLDIKTLHRKLQQELTQALSQEVRIVESSSITRWPNVKIGSDVSFELQTTDPTERETALRQRGGAGAPGRVSVLRLSPAGPLSDPLDTDSHAWVSWFERWRKLGTQDFDLVTTGWTVFWGPWGEEKKLQVLRAEWDQLQHLQAVSADSAQPHWHFDPTVPIHLGEVPPEQWAEPPLDAPVPALPSARLCISGAHLGMGAWDNADDMPSCWQRSIRTDTRDCDHILRWAVRTLCHLQGEFDPDRGHVKSSAPGLF